MKKWRWWRATDKYPGVHHDNRLDWDTEAVYRKGQSRLHFLRKLGTFNVCGKMLHIFYQSVVASAVIFAAISWGNSFRASYSRHWTS